MTVTHSSGSPMTQTKAEVTNGGPDSPPFPPGERRAVRLIAWLSQPSRNRLIETSSLSHTSHRAEELPHVPPLSLFAKRPLPPPFPPLHPALPPPAGMDNHGF